MNEQLQTFIAFTQFVRGYYTIDKEQEQALRETVQFGIAHESKMNNGAILVPPFSIGYTLFAQRIGFPESAMVFKYPFNFFDYDERVRFSSTAGVSLDTKKPHLLINPIPHVVSSEDFAIKKIGALLDTVSEGDIAYPGQLCDTLSFLSLYPRWLNDHSVCGFGSRIHYIENHMRRGTTQWLGYPFFVKEKGDTSLFLDVEYLSLAFRPLPNKNILFISGREYVF